MEFATWETLMQSTKLTLLRSFRSTLASTSATNASSRSSNSRCCSGRQPEKTPALYSLMNYADTVLGTWYPWVVCMKSRAMVRVAEKKGVRFHYNCDVKQITDDGQRVTGIELQDGTHWTAPTVVAGADYHVEQHLLPAKWRRYDGVLNSRDVTELPLFYGVNTRVPNSSTTTYFSTHHSVRTPRPSMTHRRRTIPFYVSASKNG